jgi:hypothetical protein
MDVDNVTTNSGVVSRTYDHLGLAVNWFPAPVEKFGDRLDELAARILDELIELNVLWFICMCSMSMMRRS